MMMGSIPAEAAIVDNDDENNLLMNNNNEDDEDSPNNNQKVLSDIATIRYELNEFETLVGPVYTSRCFKAHNLFWRLLFVLQEFNNNDDDGNREEEEEEESTANNSLSDDEDNNTNNNKNRNNNNVTVFILSFNETSETWGSTNPGLFAAKFVGGGSPSSTTTNKKVILFDEEGKFQMKRREIIKTNNCLNNEGNWIIDVDIQIYIDNKKNNNKDKKKPVWYPNLVNKEDDDPNNFQCKQMLESPKYADVLFLVGQNKTRFHAHRSVLYHQAPMLHDLVENSTCTTITTTTYDDDDDENDNINNAIEIPNIMESTFKALLEYIYTGKLPEIMIIKNNNDDDDDNNDNDDASKNSIFESAKDLLYATNKFGLTNLKLYLESEIITKLLNLNNAAEWLLIADGHTCALLKETCMEMYCNNPTTIKSSKIGWIDGISKSPTLLLELLDYVEMGKMCRIPIGPHDYCNMDVQTLREKLSTANLEVDGSRDVLIKRLKDHYNTSLLLSDSTTKRNIQLLR